MKEKNFDPEIYLDRNFDYAKLTRLEIRKILFDNDIHVKHNALKQEMLDKYKVNIYDKIDELKAKKKKENERSKNIYQSSTSIIDIDLTKGTPTEDTRAKNSDDNADKSKISFVKTETGHDLERRFNESRDTPNLSRSHGDASISRLYDNINTSRLVDNERTSRFDNTEGSKLKDTENNISKIRHGDRSFSNIENAEQSFRAIQDSFGKHLPSSPRNTTPVSLNEKLAMLSGKDTRISESRGEHSPKISLTKYKGKNVSYIEDKQSHIKTDRVDKPKVGVTEDRRSHIKTDRADKPKVDVTEDRRSHIKTDRVDIPNLGVSPPTHHTIINTKSEPQLQYNHDSSLLQDTSISRNAPIITGLEKSPPLLANQNITKMRIEKAKEQDKKLLSNKEQLNKMIEDDLKKYPNRKFDDVDEITDTSFSIYNGTSIRANPNLPQKTVKSRSKFTRIFLGVICVLFYIAVKSLPYDNGKCLLCVRMPAHSKLIDNRLVCDENYVFKRYFFRNKCVIDTSKNRMINRLIEILSYKHGDFKYGRIKSPGMKITELTQNKDIIDKLLKSNNVLVQGEYVISKNIKVSLKTVVIFYSKKFLLYLVPIFSLLVLFKYLQYKSRVKKRINLEAKKIIKDVLNVLLRQFLISMNNNRIQEYVFIDQLKDVFGEDERVWKFVQNKISSNSNVSTLKLENKMAWQWIGPVMRQRESLDSTRI